MSSSERSEGWIDCKHHRLKFYKESKKRLRLIAAVARNDVEGLKKLLDSPSWYNVENDYGHTLLQIAIYQENKEVFDYMLSLEDFPFDAANSRGETPLQVALTGFVNGIFIGHYYAFELLKKDVKIDIICPSGETLLHCAFYREFVRIARQLIEKGADVNALTQEGNTPLHYCVKFCSYKDLVEGVTMLLCYGADPFISNSDGEVAFDCVLCNSGDVGLAQEILFYDTFDEYSCRTISLLSLLKAAQIKWPFFYQLLEKISEVNCISCTCFDLRVLFTSIELPYLKALMEKFSYAFEDLFFNDVGEKLFEYVDFNEQSLPNIDLLIRSKVGSAVIEIIRNTDSNKLIESFIYKNTQSLMCEIICYFLSYGMTIKTGDFYLVYRKFGFCELFKILLQMDVKEYKFENPEIIPALFYNVKIYNIETYLQDPYKFSTQCGVEELLSYSSHPKLKEFCYKLNQESLIEKASNLPNIPLLMELARDVFREYFIKKFDIRTPAQFYAMLKLLPICEMHKKIISFETKLYC